MVGGGASLNVGAFISAVVGVTIFNAVFFQAVAPKPARPRAASLRARLSAPVLG